LPLAAIVTGGYLHLRHSCWLVVDCSTADEHERKAFLTASRGLVAVAARSLSVGDAEITLQQHRALVVLASRGPQRITDLADLLAVNSSTATRHCDRLQRHGLFRPTTGCDRQ